ncbi:MAG: MarR family transcriptional regulator [Desulfamplus sp.]|nr:MarR family transcriptional regulator [Desulfamplus sp.]
MKIRKVQIGIKDARALLKDFVETCESLQKGEDVKQEKGVYFTSIEAFRRAITPKRLELLQCIKNHNPVSIRHLSTLIKRDIKNVSDDIRFMEQVGLIDFKESNERNVKPFVSYDKIMIEIAV